MVWTVSLMSLRKFTKEDLEERADELCEAYIRLGAINKAAKSVGMGWRYARNILVERGLAKPRNLSVWKGTEEELEQEVARLYNDGMTVKDICSELHIGHHRFTEICRRLGLQKRSWAGRKDPNERCDLCTILLTESTDPEHPEIDPPRCWFCRMIYGSPEEHPQEEVLSRYRIYAGPK